MTEPHIRRERLAAYVAVNKTISALAREEKKTIGELVDETLEEVDKSCERGSLGTDIMSFERDPDEGRY